MIPDPIRYSGLSQPYGWIQTFEAAESSPIEGSKASLRNPQTGSPFTLEVLLPEPLVTSFLTGENTSVPRGLFDPFLEEVNELAQQSFQNELGTRVPQNVNIGLVDSSLRSGNNFGKVMTRYDKFRSSSYVGTVEGIQNLERIVYGEGSTNQSRANQPASADLRQALEVVLMVNRMLRVPKLEMLINPQSFSISYSKSQDYSSRSRYGYIFQAWGEEQPRIQVSGKIGAFISGTTEVINGQTVTVSGAQWNSMEDSASYQNLMNLFAFYRNNAYLYENLEKTRANLWIGDIMLTYDNKAYLGSFESMSYSFEESQPNGGIVYNFGFIVSREFDLQSTGPVFPIGTSGQSVLNPGTSAIQATEQPSGSGVSIFSPFNSI